MSGRGARPGAGLGDGGQIFDWFSTGDYPSREYPSFRLTPPNASMIDFNAARADAVVAGRTTYEHSDRFGGGSPKPGVPLFVLSHETIPDADPRQTIVTDGVESAIRQAKRWSQKRQARVSR